MNNLFTDGSSRAIQNCRMNRLIFVLALNSLLALPLNADPPTVTGKWLFTLDMSHGKRNGTLDLQQDGEKLSGTGELEKHGSSTITGSAQGAKVSITIKLHGGSFTLIGTVEGDKMSGTTDPAGGTWNSTRRLD
jgi:hypothetical protein